MADEAPHTATTEAPHEGGFPPFDTTTFPSQIFWLVVTFAFLFTVLWKVAGPRINGAITQRRRAINGAIAGANAARGEAEAAEAAYRTALAGARARASALAEENRQALNAEVARAKAEADEKAAAAMAKADADIAATREAAKAQVSVAARDTAIAIVAHLTGDQVSPEDAADAVKS
ncbi:MAG: F0F1 ATP synthase subunit B' [Alphaproteobacteria bacterium]|nr:F0F1 ATP synthase subunit B' [Alphaproteobacteria bacterium]